MLKIMKKSTHEELLQNINDLALVVEQLLNEREQTAEDHNHRLNALAEYAEAKGW